MVEMHVADVRLDVRTNIPVVLLQEVGGRGRTLVIYIGRAEAEAINLALRGAVTPRPMTHDLFRDVLGAIGATLERIVVTELRMDGEGNGTFLSELHVQIGKERLVVSARPSDAIALAIRTGSPMFADDAVVESESVIPDEPDEEEEQEELVGQFHDFVENLRPEDFAS